MTKPLTGTLVVSLDQAVAAPLTARRLADAGARVIKLERPEGDFARDYDRLVHGASARTSPGSTAARNPSSPTSPSPRTGACSRRSLAKADVLVQNLKPGALAKLGYPHRGAAQALPPAHLLLDLGLRRRRPLPRPQGLRPADPGRVGARLRHRRTRGAGARRRLHRRHLHRHARLRGDPGGADRARPHRPGRRHPRLHVRLHDGVDGRADALRPSTARRPSASASATPRSRPTACSRPPTTCRSSSPSRTTASGWCSAPRCWSSPSSAPTRASPPTRRALANRRRDRRPGGALLRRARRRHAVAPAGGRPRSPSPASTTCRTSCATRTCGA